MERPDADGPRAADRSLHAPSEAHANPLRSWSATAEAATPDGRSHADTPRPDDLTDAFLGPHGAFAPRGWPRRHRFLARVDATLECRRDTLRTLDVVAPAARREAARLIGIAMDVTYRVAATATPAELDARLDDLEAACVEAVCAAHELDRAHGGLSTTPPIAGTRRALSHAVGVAGSLVASGARAGDASLWALAAAGLQHPDEDFEILRSRQADRTLRAESMCAVRGAWIGRAAHLYIAVRCADRLTAPHHSLRSLKVCSLVSAEAARILADTALARDHERFRSHDAWSASGRWNEEAAEMLRQAPSAPAHSAGTAGDILLAELARTIAAAWLVEQPLTPAAPASDPAD